MSRLTPTMPVIAPPKGSNALGELWVSAFMQRLQSSFHAMTPELSWKTLRSQSTCFWISSVGLMMCVLNRESMVEDSPVSLSL